LAGELSGGGREAGNDKRGEASCFVGCGEKFHFNEESGKGMEIGLKKNGGLGSFPKPPL
jgi:hypothetical protein